MPYLYIPVPANASGPLPDVPVFSDTFTYSNADLVNYLQWQPQTYDADNNILVDGNAIRYSTPDTVYPGDCYVTWNLGSAATLLADYGYFTNNQYAETTIGTAPTSGYQGPVCLAGNDTWESPHGIYGQVSATAWRIYVAKPWTNASITQTIATGSGTFTSGDVIRLETHNNGDIKLYQDGSLLGGGNIDWNVRAYGQQPGVSFSASSSTGGTIAGFASGKFGPDFANSRYRPYSTTSLSSSTWGYCMLPITTPGFYPSSYGGPSGEQLIVVGGTRTINFGARFTNASTASRGVRIKVNDTTVLATKMSSGSHTELSDTYTGVFTKGDHVHMEAFSASGTSSQRVVAYHDNTYLEIL